MPTFGDFDTVGDPISVTEESGRISTIWEAQNTSGREGQGRRYVVKCLDLRRSPRTEARSDEELAPDVGLEFLDAVKALVSAQANGGPSGRCLVPVAGFGTCEEGVWYATEHRPRESLKEWISLQGRVDHPALRNVAACLVAGCLALQRTSGRSHGNLKPGNVLLAGRAGLLRATQLQLADPRPASLLRASQLDPADQRTLDDLRRDAAELHDLQGIGEILYQLVRGDLLRRKGEYDYPVENSTKWQRLGKHGAYWLEVCNRLLNPQLTLEQENLEKLEKEFGPPVAGDGGKRLLVATSVATACVVVALVCWLLVRGPHQDPAKLKQMQDAIAAGKGLLDQTNFSAALLRFDDATRIAQDLKDQRSRQLSKDFQHLANLLDQASSMRADPNRVDDEIELLNQASERVRKLNEQQLIGAIERWLVEARNRRAVAIRAQFRKAIDLGQRSLEATQCTEASQYFADAINLAKKLGEKASEDEAKSDSGYAAARCKAEAAEANMKYEDAIALWQQAVKFKPGDELATRRQARAEANAEFVKRLGLIKTALESPGTDDQRLGSLFDDAERRTKEAQIDSQLIAQENGLRVNWNERVKHIKAAIPDLLKSAGQDLDSGKYENAKSEFNQVLVKDSKNQDAKNGINFIESMEKARQFKTQADYANAEANYSNALKLRRNDARADSENAVCTNVSLGEYYLASGNLPVARDAFEQARQRDAADLNVQKAARFVQLLSDGDRAYVSGEFEKAAGDYTDAMDIKRYQASCTTRVELARDRVNGESLISKGRYDTEAITNLQTAANLEVQLKLEPNDGKGATNSAADAVKFAKLAAEADSALTADQPDYSKAVAKYDQALTLRPRDGQVRDRRNRAKSRADEFAEHKTAIQAKAAFDLAVSNLTTLHFGEASDGFSKLSGLLANSTNKVEKAAAENGKRLAEALKVTDEQRSSGDYNSAYTSACNAIGIWPAHDDIAKRQAVKIAITSAKAGQSSDPDVSLEWTKRALRLDTNNVEARALHDSVTAVISSDYTNATKALDDCRFEDADIKCKSHANNPGFADLIARIQSERSNLTSAQNALNQGKYGELLALTNSYGTNRCFDSLFKTGNERNAWLVELQGLIGVQNQANNAPFCSPMDFKAIDQDYARWSKVDTNFRSLPAEVKTNSAFEAVNRWTIDHDPRRELDLRLYVFKIWFDMIGNTNKLVNPGDNREISKQNKGIPLDYYTAMLNELSKRCVQLNMKDDQTFKKLGSRISSWNF